MNPHRPWWPLSVITHLDSLLTKQMNVFEFGSGESTLWLSDRVHHVTTTEHHKLWYDKLMSSKPQNVTAQFIPLSYGDRYAKSCKATGQQYDVIIVDGMDRNECVWHSMWSLKSNGIIVLDDSQREAYLPAHELLMNAGYVHTPFLDVENNRLTSVFRKSEPELGI